LQRVHNEKSLKPLIQIDWADRHNLIYVHVQNNGVGPFIIEKLTFTIDGKCYSNIEDCLELDPRSYQHISINGSITKVILPGNYFEVFSMQRRENDSDREIDNVRQQLSVLSLKVEGRDIYNNKIVTERDLTCFMRHGVA
jgi:hypothetical protein